MDGASRIAPVGGPLPLVDAASAAAAAAAPLLPLLPLLLLLLPLLPAAPPLAAAPASSSALTAAAAGDGWFSEGGTRPKVCWISSLVCCAGHGGRVGGQAG